MPSSFFANIWRTSDESPPLVDLGRGGVDVDGVSTPIVAANAARVRVDVMNAGDVRVWLGVGAAAQVGVGHFLDPGGYFGEFTAVAVEALSDDGTACLVTHVEWGT